MDKSVGVSESIATVEDERWRIEAIWLGEGFDGDYNSEDDEDEPLMRFDVFDKDAEEGTDARNPWSFCTMVKAANKEACQRFIERVLDVMQQNRYPKRELEWLTWWNGESEEPGNDL